MTKPTNAADFAFSRWLDRLLEEKSIDTDMQLEIEGPSGLNIMPLSMVVDAVKAAPIGERRKIQDTLVKIDFANGDILHFFKHLAKALAQ